MLLKIFVLFDQTCISKDSENTHLSVYCNALDTCKKEKCVYLRNKMLITIKDRKSNLREMVSENMFPLSVFYGLLYAKIRTYISYRVYV